MVSEQLASASARSALVETSNQLSSEQVALASARSALAETSNQLSSEQLALASARCKLAATFDRLSSEELASSSARCALVETSHLLETEQEASFTARNALVEADSTLRQRLGDVEVALAAAAEAASRQAAHSAEVLEVVRGQLVQQERAWAVERGEAAERLAELQQNVTNQVGAGTQWQQSLYCIPWAAG